MGHLLRTLCPWSLITFVLYEIHERFGVLNQKGSIYRCLSIGHTFYSSLLKEDATRDLFISLSKILEACTTKVSLKTLVHRVGYENSFL